MAEFVGIMAKFVHQFGQILHNEGGGKCRIISGFVADYGAFSIFNGKTPRRAF